METGTATTMALTNAALAGSRETVITVAAGRIADIGSQIPDGAVVVDLGGRLVLPALIDAHVHLDKTLLGLPWQPHRAGNTVIDRIEAEKCLRRRLMPDVEACGARLLALALSNGTTFVRSHVDIDDQVGLANVEAVLRLRETWSALIDIQLVAFPQSGIKRCPGTVQLMDEAMTMGCDLVGGLDPAGIDGDVEGHLDVVFGLAARHGVGVDIHLHDQGEVGIEELSAIADRTKALGLSGMVVVSHAFCLGSVSEERATYASDRLAGAGVAILTSGPGAAPMPPVTLLRRAGVRVIAGSDNVRDAWSPFGNASMLERCWLIAWRSGFRTDADLEATLTLATHDAAAALGIPAYGLAPGAHADLTAFSVGHVAQAIIERPQPDLVLRKGLVVHDRADIAGSRIPRLRAPAA